MVDPSIYGLVWGVCFYLTGVLILIKSEQKLAVEYVPILNDVRRPLKKFALLLVCIIALSVIFRANSSWLVLIVLTIVAITVLLVKLHGSSLPKTFVQTYTLSGVLIALGWIGFGISLGVKSGFTL